MRVYVPPRLRAGRPLVVVLHGCGQDASHFAAEAGWLELADRARCALLLPVQVFENNPGRCFNWFRPEDASRGSGEALSIRQMLRHLATRLNSDRKRVFIAGFSAGGGMTAALLAAYPAVFAAGGVVAGMPAGSAFTQITALLRMHRADSRRSRAALAEDARRFAPRRRRWPRLSIWQGLRDRTVAPDNAELLAAQWTALHGIDPAPGLDTAADGIRHRVWRAARRPPAVELWTLAALGHGFPVDAATPGDGRTGAWVTGAGISAVRRMADFWGLDQAGR
jgi:poly(hydroxyalkanoate) depolymerase family esterase